MIYKGFGNRGKQKGKGHSAGPDYCKCSRCGYLVRHIPGIPCRSVNCPVCHLPLVRDSANAQEKSSVVNHAQTKTMDLPEVNPEICTGCGRCIDVCPMEAISIENEKAFIHEDICGNCRVCVSECPIEAIS